MPDRDGPGHDFAPEKIQDFLRRLPSSWQRQGHQALADIGRHDAIDRLRRQVAQVLADHHGGARAEAVEFRPILGEGMHVASSTSCRGSIQVAIARPQSSPKPSKIAVPV